MSTTPTTTVTSKQGIVVEEELSLAAQHPEYFNCRMYENRYPEVEELVMVTVKRITEMGVYVTLAEYNNIEGMIVMGEVSRKRIRSINKIVRVGKQEVVVVVRVDKEKGYIDLSKRRVSPPEVIRCDDKFNKSKTVHSIMRHFAELRARPLEDLYKIYAWPLYKKCGHAYDAFKMAVQGDPKKVWEGIEGTTEADLEELVRIIKRRMTPQPTKARADIEVTCFRYEGIDSLKQALAKGEECGTEAVPLTIKLVAPPAFVLFTQALEKQQALSVLTSAIESIKAEITSLGGNLVVRQPPRAISDREETEFAAMLENMEMDEGEEGANDTDGESSEGGGSRAGGAASSSAGHKSKGGDEEGDSDGDSDGEDDDEDSDGAVDAEDGKLRKVPPTPK